MKIFKIVGRKGSGKAQILENLISLLKTKGLRTGVIKHLAREEFDIDQPGKDTDRYRKQGAETVMLAGRKKFAVFSESPEDIGIEDLLLFFQDFDVVFLEGYYDENFPGIEIYRAADEEPPCAGRMPGIAAICTDKAAGFPVPAYATADIEGLASFLIEYEGSETTPC